MLYLCHRWLGGSTMFVIDYLKENDSNRILVPSFHGADVGFLSRSTHPHIALLQSTARTAGCELCVTPYERPLEYLFRLRCVLRARRGVLHKLLRALSVVNLNILSLDSATFESTDEQRISMLLDWSTTTSPTRVTLPQNLRRLFFPLLSGIIPPHDLRYLRLLRQILAQCADEMLWDMEPGSNCAVPRVRLTEFEEPRLIATRGSSHLIELGSKSARRQDNTGFALTIDSHIAADLRLATGRTTRDRLHYILTSDSESETLHVQIPRRGREKRMAHLAFSYTNLPGALCAITAIIDGSQLSTVSGLVRTSNADRNIFEVTLEHDARNISHGKLGSDPVAWAHDHLRLDTAPVKDWLRYYRIALESPDHTREPPLDTQPLHDGHPPQHSVRMVTAEQAERDVLQMASRAGADHDFIPRRWLTNLLFAPEWGPNGKPSIFLSYPRVAADDAALIQATLEQTFAVVALQDGDVEYITEGTIERIVQSHYFVGVWHPETTTSGTSWLSPWIPFEYGVALSHDKQCVILSHRSLPHFIADRISRETARIAYSNLASEPEKLVELVRRCESWETGHRRLNATATEYSPAVSKNRQLPAAVGEPQIATRAKRSPKRQRAIARKPLSIFISYARESDEHTRWVRNLADAIERFAEFDVTFDQYDLHGGKDLLHFMDRGLACDRIVVVITPEYVRKATRRIGGVGYESSVISADLLTDQLAARIVPVMRSGDKVPRFLRTKLYVDMRAERDFLVGITDLHRALHGSGAARRPSKQTAE